MRLSTVRCRTHALACAVYLSPTRHAHEGRARRTQWAATAIAFRAYLESTTHAEDAATKAGLHKLTALRNGRDVPVRRPSVYRREQTSGPARLAASVSEDPLGILLDLAGCREGELYVLFVLTVLNWGTGWLRTVLMSSSALPGGCAGSS